MSQIESLVLHGEGLFGGIIGGRVRLLLEALDQVDALRKAKSVPAMANIIVSIAVMIASVTPSATDDEIIGKVADVLQNPKVVKLLDAAGEVWDEYKPKAA